MYRTGEDFHRVGDVMPNTWTLVTTGPRKQEWGFWPQGEKWQYYRDYLNLEESC